MSDVIRVSVIRRDGRKFFECRWLDPVTGRKKTKSCKTTVRRDAERFAARLETQLQQGESVTKAITWKEFREVYENTVFPFQSKKTKATTTSTLNSFEKHINPARLSSISPKEIQAFSIAVRNDPGKRKQKEDGPPIRNSEHTVKKHLSELRKVLNWAMRHGYIRKVPHIDIPRKLPAMKGRPITREELERMLDAVDGMFKEEYRQGWKFLLEGLWNSGLRLGEAERLHWTDDRDLCVEINSPLPMFRIQSHAEKGKQFRMLPMAPEFAEQLKSVPESQRVGLVFNVCGIRNKRGRPQPDWISKVISRIGENANVKVSERNSEPKFASAHDLRRAFGFRWSQMVLPPVLMEMMRHESIQTTMAFYVGRNANAAAQQVWDAYRDKVAKSASGNTSGNTHVSNPNSPPSTSKESR